MAKLTTDWSIEVSHLSGDEFEVRLQHEDCVAIAIVVLTRGEDVVWPAWMACYAPSELPCGCGASMPDRSLIADAIRTYAERLAERIERDRGMP